MKKISNTEVELKQNVLLIKKFLYPLDKGHKLNVHKTFKDVQNVFCTFYARSIYALSPGGMKLLKIPKERQ